MHFLRMFRIALEAFVRIFPYMPRIMGKHSGLKVNCGMYRTSSIVEKFRFSVNRLIDDLEWRKTRTEFATVFGR